MTLPETVEDTHNIIATLRYNGWYRSQEISHMNVSYHESHDQIKGTQIGFTGTGLTTHQKLIFAITSMKRNDEGKICEMTGLYESWNPIDRGNWSLCMNT
jgi:hypothetical protein